MLTVEKKKTSYLDGKFKGNIDFSDKVYQQKIEDSFTSAEEENKDLQKLKQQEDSMQKYVKVLENLFGDKLYQEVDGVYIVYQGYVDILS